MASLERRVEALEGLIGQPEEDPEAAARWALMRAILDEFALLKSSGAVHYRANVRIEPEDIPGKVLGPAYTVGDVVGLACRRVAERELSGYLDEGEMEETVEGWTRGMRSLYERVGKGHVWDRVERERA